MARTKKHIPPSRVRYEKSHPVVSCRVKISERDRIEVVKQADGKSNTDILLLGLELAEPQVKKAEQLKKQALDDGYKKGFAAAKARYVVNYPCSVCGKMISATSANEKVVMSEHMQELKWAHGECVEQSQ